MKSRTWCISPASTCSHRSKVGNALTQGSTTNSTISSAFRAAIHASPKAMIVGQWHSVKSCISNGQRRGDRKRRSASIADVLPLLFAPTKSVVVFERSTRVDNNFLKLAISKNSICTTSASHPVWVKNNHRETLQSTGVLSARFWVETNSA
ncbi:hypothetical protein D3C87_1269870 [compost metagenome]